MLFIPKKLNVLIVLTYSLLKSNKYNLTFLSLNKEKFILEDNNYQYEYGTEIKRITHYYNDTGFIDNAVNDFWWNATFYQKHEMNKPNKLFTRYK